VALPDFQSIFKPLLQLSADGQEHSMKEAREHLAKHFNLTDEDRAELLPSGTQKTFDNRVAWAKSYLVQAKVLFSTRRAHFKITERGREFMCYPPR
jgi:restriction system protein